MDSGQICDSFLGFFTALCLDDLNPESRRQGIEKVYQAIAMILAKPACTAMGMHGAFDDQKPMGNCEQRLELPEKARPIVGWIRENSIDVFRASTFDTKNIRRLFNGVVAGRQGLYTCSGDPNESFECIGLCFVYIDQEMDGRHHDFRMTEPGDVQHGLRPA